MRYNYSRIPLITMFFLVFIVGCVSTRRFKPNPTPQPAPEQDLSREEAIERLQRSLLKVDVLEARIAQKKYEMDVLAAKRKNCQFNCGQLDQEIAALNIKVLEINEEISEFTKEERKQLCAINPQQCQQ